MPDRNSEIEPLLIDARRLAALLCCGLRTIRCWDAAGLLPEPLRIGGRVLWRTEEINEWVRAGSPDRSTWAQLVAAGLEKGTEGTEGTPNRPPAAYAISHTRTQQPRFSRA